jgi:hypothetical protein
LFPGSITLVMERLSLIDREIAQRWDDGSDDEEERNLAGINDFQISKVFRDDVTRDMDG